jgi:pseudaminic acid biosynthesis-associated methylase
MSNSPIRTKTEQERFWEGDFGITYTDRNSIRPEDRLPFFRKVLQETVGVISVCELGANRGHNLIAIQKLSPNFQLTGIELNEKAFSELSQQSNITAIHSSIQDFAPQETFDLLFICGVLIHLNPDDLTETYRKMFRLSSRYILINEYYNPTPTELTYRGHEKKLFKRDFGGEFIDANEIGVRVVDYGFLWQRLEPAWDNSTWWLFEKI